jgi:protein SCO1/2
MIKCPVLVMAALSLICLPFAVVLRGNLVSSAIVDEPTVSGRPSQDGGCCCESKDQASADRLSDKSLYHLESSWTRQDNQTIHLSQLRGKVQVIAMIFTHCPASCPRLIEDMKHLESQLGARHGADIGYVLVSLDPDRDSPQLLKEYGEAKQLHRASWTLLHGRPDDVRELAAVLGVRYKEVGEGNITHSNLISVLNKDGELVFQQEGLGLEPTAIMQAIQTTLEFCQ